MTETAKVRGAKGTYNCKGCKQPFEARVADRNRGWARYCSKSCKATAQYNAPAKSKYKRHDGRSPMKHKKCDTCGAPAINGIYTSEGIEWGCEMHHDNSHPFSSDALGQG